MFHYAGLWTNRYDVKGRPCSCASHHVPLLTNVTEPDSQWEDRHQSLRMVGSKWLQILHTIFFWHQEVPAWVEHLWWNEWALLYWNINETCHWGELIKPTETYDKLSVFLFKWNSKNFKPNLIGSWRGPYFSILAYCNNDFIFLMGAVIWPVTSDGGSLKKPENICCRRFYVKCCIIWLCRGGSGPTRSKIRRHRLIARLVRLPIKAGRNVSSVKAHLQHRQKVQDIAILSQSWLAYVAILWET